MTRAKRRRASDVTRWLAVACLAAASGCAKAERIDTPRAPWVGELLTPAEHVEVLQILPQNSRLSSIAHAFDRLDGGHTVYTRTGPLGAVEREQVKHSLQSILASDGGMGQRVCRPGNAVLVEHEGHRLVAVLKYGCGTSEFWYDGTLRDEPRIGSDGREQLDALLARADAWPPPE